MPTDDSVPNGGRGEVMLQLSERARERGEYFFYVRVRQDMGPRERGRRYEDPLDQALRADDVGRVTGGGSQLGEGDTIEYFGIDVRVIDREQGLSCIRSAMQQCGAPKDAVVEQYLPTYVEHDIWD